jgi:integrase
MAAYPKLSLEERERLQKQDLPSVLRGLTFLNKKGSKSPVKAKDIWTDEDTALFLKYCLDPRLACFHAMARDTSARPGELLAVRLGDIEIKKTAEGKMYVQLEVGRYGKRKEPRIVPMTTSIPYYRSWLALHPLGSSGNPDAFCSSLWRGVQNISISQYLVSHCVLIMQRCKINTCRLY